MKIIIRPTKAFSIVLITTLLAISIFVTGCAEPEPYIEDTATPTATPTATATPNTTAIATLEPTETIPTSTVEPQESLIRIDNQRFIPVGDKEINVGDTIKWMNREGNKQPRTLINEDGIWDEEQFLTYTRSVSYTFNESGVYTFYLKSMDTRTLTITVV